MQGMGAIWQGFIFLFFVSMGIPTWQLGVLWMVQAVSAILFEIPSGMFADRYGRKASMLACSSGYLLALVIFLTQTGFIWFAFAMVLWGVERAFFSGSLDALMVDSYNQDGVSGYKSYTSRYVAYNMYTIAVGTVIGGFIAEVSLLYVFIIGVIGTLAQLYLYSHLKEAKKEAINESQYVHWTSAWKELRLHKIAFLLFLFSIVVSVVNGIYRYHPVYFETVGHSYFSIGILFGVMMFVAGFASHHTDWLEKRFGSGLLALIYPFLIGGTYVLLGSFPLYFVSFIILFESVAAGYLHPLFEPIFQSKIKSKYRATISSIQGFGNKLTQIIVALSVGFFADWFSLPAVYTGLGIIVLLLGFPLIVSIVSKSREDFT